jgi:hypothetical protein
MKRNLNEYMDAKRSALIDPSWEDVDCLLAAIEEARKELDDLGNSIEIKRVLLEKANHEAIRQRGFKESTEARLAEAQRQLAEEKKWRAVEHEVAGGYHRELVEAQQTIEEADKALDLSIEETKRWSTLANSAMADNERLRRLLEERGEADPEEGEIQP